jgi:hypothetical protein
VFSATSVIGGDASDALTMIAAGDTDDARRAADLSAAQAGTAE